MKQFRKNRFFYHHYHKEHKIMQGTFRFSFGPWNIHEGADPFGPEVRNSIPFNKKLESYKKMGFDGKSLFFKRLEKFAFIK